MFRRKDDLTQLRHATGARSRRCWIRTQAAASAAFFPWPLGPCGPHQIRCPCGWFGGPRKRASVGSASLRQRLLVKACLGPCSIGIDLCRCGCDACEMQTTCWVPASLKSNRPDNRPDQQGRNRHGGDS